jgi:hypothetical protein
MDESDRQINFNSLKKSVTSLPAAIVIIDEFDRQINFNSLKKSATSLSVAIGALGSRLGPPHETCSRAFPLCVLHHEAKILFLLVLFLFSCPLERQKKIFWNFTKKI